jgi:hypothetical protein
MNHTPQSQHADKFTEAGCCMLAQQHVDMPKGKCGMRRRRRKGKLFMFNICQTRSVRNSYDTHYIIN